LDVCIGGLGIAFGGISIALYSTQIFEFRFTTQFYNLPASARLAKFKPLIYLFALLYVVHRTEPHLI
jgi:hypothetical protein